MLLLACVIWGMGFNWNKLAQQVLGDRLAEVFAEPSLVALGPAAFLAIRFILATILWALLFPGSLRGWNRRTAIGGLTTGVFLSSGTLLQHYGLAHTSESLSAFLTSLTVLFTPLLAVFVLRQRVSGWLWLCVGCATAGVALMTLFRQEAGFDRGALLGLLCAVVFSGYMLALDYFGKRDDRSRLTLAQLVAATAVFVVFALVFPGGTKLLDVAGVADAMNTRTFLILLLLTTAPGTIIPFGLMFRYQPDTTPTRAALTYLSEPIFATAYAWIAVGTIITPGAILGAGLIFVGNLLAEFLGRTAPEEE